MTPGNVNHVLHLWLDTPISTALVSWYNKSKRANKLAHSIARFCNYTRGNNGQKTRIEHANFFISKQVLSLVHELHPFFDNIFWYSGFYLQGEFGIKLLRNSLQFYSLLSKFLLNIQRLKTIRGTTIPELMVSLAFQHPFAYKDISQNVVLFKG